MDKKTNLLLIAVVGFILVFTIVIILVNNWLKTTLKEETITASQTEAVVETPNQTYRQMPIVVAPAEQKVSAATQKKTLEPETSSGETSSGINASSPKAGGARAVLVD